MEELEFLISNKNWSEALILSNSLGIKQDYVAKLQLLSLNLNLAINSNLILELLNKIIEEDNLWVASFCLKLLTTTNNDNQELTKKLIELGLKATSNYINSHEILKDLVTNEDNNNNSNSNLERLIQDNELIKKLTIIRKTLLELEDKFKTWVEIWGNSIKKVVSKESNNEQQFHNDEESPEEEEEAGWDELEPSTSPTFPSTTDESTNPSLNKFLNTSLLEIVYTLSASASINPLLMICKRHVEDELWVYRFEILDLIPEWVEPSTYLEILPALGADEIERKWISEPWRKEKDWSEKLIMLQSSEEDDVVGGRKYLTGEELTNYYKKRIELLSNLGLISIALNLVQCGASLSITGLEELGEELSLLSKLVYDRPSASSTTSISTTSNSSNLNVEDLTLDYWRSLSPIEVVQAYLAYSTVNSIATDIRRLVLPYLFVLESRLERTGTPNPNYSNSILTTYILSLVDQNRIDLLVPIFKESNPTLEKSKRLIENNQDLTKLALTCLYSYSSKEINSETLDCFNKIFECLPTFDDVNSTTTTSPTQEGTKQSLFSSTITSYTPLTLYETLQSFTIPSLSTALDALDLHLATLEILSRYSVPVPLNWFLSSYHDKNLQTSLCVKMSRISSTGGEFGEPFVNEDEWEGLLEDMVGLTEEEEDEEEGEEETEGMKKAFWLVGRKEVTKIFFAGLLASGNFSLAKRLLHPSNGIESPLSPEVEEELIISASHEFYDNAESGNLHKGEMKLAFDCLATAIQTPRIKKEKDFIEATSRLCSFKIYSQPGIPITPIQIRLSKDRLDFVSRLLASNEDAYRHPDVVMELVKKLGYEGDKGAEIKVLAMIADSGLQAGDYLRAADICDKMVGVVEVLRGDQVSSSSSNNGNGNGNGNSIVSEKMVEEGAEVAWRNCFQLGKHEEFNDLNRRMKLLGQALILCPGNKITTLLPVWSNLENLILNKGQPEESYTSNKSSIPSTSTSKLPINITTSAPSPPRPLPEIPSTASRTFSRAQAFLPFSIGGGPTRNTTQQPRAQSPKLPNPPPPPPIQVRTRPSSGGTGQSRASPPPSMINRSQSPIRPQQFQQRAQSPLQPQQFRTQSPLQPSQQQQRSQSPLQPQPQSQAPRQMRPPPPPPSRIMSPPLRSLAKSPPNISSNFQQPQIQFSNRRTNMTRSGSGSSVGSSTSGTGGGIERGISNSMSTGPSSSSNSNSAQSLSQSQRTYSSQPSNQQQQQYSQGQQSQSQSQYSNQSNFSSNSHPSNFSNQSTNSINPNRNPPPPPSSQQQPPQQREISRDMWDRPDDGLFGVGVGISSRVNKGFDWLIGANEEER